MQFSILGPVEVRDGDGVRLRLSGALRRAVLAVLLLDVGQVVSDQALVSAVWAVPPATALAQLRQHVSALRRLLGNDAILRRGSGYVLAVDPGSVDLTVFTERAERARAALAEGRTAEAAALFREALALWRGDPLAGAAHDLVRRAAPALEERRLAALEDCFDAELAEGRHGELVGEILAHLDRHPLRERMRGQLMLALYRCGRRSEALRVFRDGRVLLCEELGLEPGPELRRLEHAVHVGDPALDLPAAAPVRAGARPRLPADLVDFTGRSAEIAATVRALTAVAPALCVVGGGPGVGKSALAVRVAHLLGDAFPDGRLHVDLHAHGGDPGRALERLLRLLGVAETGVPATLEERAELYRDLMADQRALVVLDGAADERAVRPLLPGAPGCAVLVTARGPLPGLAGAERIGLGPFEAGEAHRLLARIIGPARAEAEPAGIAEVAGLCGRLPLALRIAGTRLAARPHGSVARFAARLRTAPRRLDELRTADLDLRAVLADGVAGLDEDARRAFRAWGAGGADRFCAAGAARVLGESLERAEDLIEALAGAGLVEYAGNDPGGHDTYRVPEPLRWYAAELADAGAGACSDVGLGHARERAT
ncbi:BTAD domain-containing putative transcriptional regulator [Actinomadura kijaniata]|uniref:AfsR/SARP family transcriptional regulator n=1 Tax=Actinomadura kijaniata TaxID=46161 RepID=UPI003F1ACFCC